MVRVDSNGMAEFNEKIEMKTLFEYDKSRGQFTAKEATLRAMLVDGTNLGSVDVNLADYANPDTYHK